MDREFFVVLAHLPLPCLVPSERSHSFRRLRPLGQEYFRPDLCIAFGSGLLLALRPVPTLGEPDRSLVKLSFAPVSGLSVLNLIVFMRWFRIVLLSEE